MADFNHALLSMAPVRGAPIRNLLLADDEGAISSAASRITWAFQAKEAALIEKAGFRYAGGFGVPPEQVISLQGLGPNGLPDGVILASGTFRPPTTGTSWNDTFQWVDFGAGYSMRRGEFLTLNIEYHSGTIGLGNSSFYTIRVQGGGTRYGFPYIIQPGGQRNADRGVFGLKANDGTTYGRPIVSILSDNFNSGLEKGMRFVLDAEYGETFRLAGVRWQGRPQGQAGNSYDIVLYEQAAGGSPIEKQRVSVDADRAGVVSFDAGAPGEIGSGDRVSEIYFDELTLPDLTFGTEYFLVISPNGTTLNTQLTVITCNDNEDLSAFPGGAEFYLCQRSGGTGQFNVNNSQRPLIDLIIDDWGRPSIPTLGLHVKVNPRYNDNLFIEHGADMISDDSEIEGERHESVVTVIGDAVKSYGGYKTVEVFKDPDEFFSPEFIAAPEQNIEQLKLAKWDPVVEELVRLVFRLRAETGSAHFTDVEQFVRVIRESPASQDE